MASPSQYLAEALRQHQASRYGEAAILYRYALAEDPAQADVLHLLGVLSHQTGGNAKALGLIKRALAIQDDVAAYHSNLGAVLKSEGRGSEASAHFLRAVRLRPQDARNHNNLGLAYFEQNDRHRACVHYKVALALDPALAESLYNLGMITPLDEKARAFRRAIVAKPDYAKAHTNLAATFDGLRDFTNAAACFRRALVLDPGDVESFRNLAVALDTIGDRPSALATILKALVLEESTTSKILFCECLEGVRLCGNSVTMRQLLQRALKEGWYLPDHSAMTVADLLLSSPPLTDFAEKVSQGEPEIAILQALGRDHLLLSFLYSSAVPDWRLEQILTACRSALLNYVLEDRKTTTDNEEPLLNFCCALAQQCFLNEYIFAYGKEDVDRVEHLKTKINSLRTEQQPIPPMMLAITGTFLPLHQLADAPRYLTMRWPEPLRNLLDQQIAQPLEERRIANSLPRLTSIEDPISVIVQQQYEENPYPRWAVPAQPEPSDTIEDHLKKYFPNFLIDPAPKERSDFLIAGCGTGYHSTERARSFPKANILAVDISSSSLAYAARMTQSLGLTNLRHAQADLLSLPDTGLEFDVIESVGVLHHLADPFAGLMALCRVLRPKGLMRLGLYSEIARRNVVAVRDMIARRGYRSTIEDIRRCRQDLASLDDDDFRKFLARSVDFRTTSRFRDLVFHVQEHRLTLPQIANWLDQSGLRFAGFELERHQRHAFACRFSDPNAEIDLMAWHRFEEQNPYTFTGMYILWCQKL